MLSTGVGGDVEGGAEGGSRGLGDEVETVASDEGEVELVLSGRRHRVSNIAKARREVRRQDLAAIRSMTISGKYDEGGGC